MLFTSTYDCSFQSIGRIESSVDKLKNAILFTLALTLDFSNDLSTVNNPSQLKAICIDVTSARVQAPARAVCLALFIFLFSGHAHCVGVTPPYPRNICLKRKHVKRCSVFELIFDRMHKAKATLTLCRHRNVFLLFLFLLILYGCRKRATFDFGQTCQSIFSLWLNFAEQDPNRIFSADRISQMLHIALFSTCRPTTVTHFNIELWKYSFSIEDVLQSFTCDSSVFIIIFQ